MRKITKKGLFTAVAAIAVVIGGVMFGSTGKASAAVKCYTIGTSNVQVYSNTGLTRKLGTIFPSDQITVNTVTDRYCKVTYPVARGTKTGYIQTGKILTRTNGNTHTSRAQVITYRRPGGSSYGYISKGDGVKVLGTSGGYTQIKYPVSGGYKYAFVSTANCNAYITAAADEGGFCGIGYNGTVAEIEQYCFDAKYYADTYSDLRAVFGYDSSKLLNHWKMHGIREGRSGSPVLDLKYYMANNKDLRSAFGSTNYTRAYQHFVEHGYAEYRASSKYYNGDYYRRNNRDLRGFDSKFLVRHYLYHGIQEGRYANTVRYIPAGSSSSASSAPASGVDFSAVRAKYPSYSKWNGSYKNKAWQCHGFAVTLGDAITGTDPYNWKRIYNLNSLKAGDIVVFKRPHTIMVTGVSGNTITYVDCNWVAKNTVKWDQTILRSKMTSKFGSLKYVMVCPK